MLVNILQTTPYLSSSDIKVLCHRSFFLFLSFSEFQGQVAIMTKMIMLSEEYSKPIIIREVCADNLEYEFVLTREVVGEYSLVSIDTEFSGVIHTPKVNHRNLQSLITTVT